MDQKTLVIFDVDDTLLNSMKNDSQSFSETFKEMYGQALRTIDWTQYPHVTDTTIFNTAFEQIHNRNPRKNEVDSFRNRFVERILNKRANNPSGFTEISGAKQIVNFLLEHEDYAVGIATGGWMAPAKAKLEYMGFDVTHIHDCYADEKITREDILTGSVEKAQVEYEHLRPVYIGDAIWDVYTTRNLQMDFVGIRYKEDYQVLEREGATQVISNYDNVQGFLQMVDQATPPLPVEKIPNF